MKDLKSEINKNNRGSMLKKVAREKKTKETKKLLSFILSLLVLLMSKEVLWQSV